MLTRGASHPLLLPGSNILYCHICLVRLAHNAFSQASAEPQRWLSKAEEAAKENNRDKAFFAIARYIGVSLQNDKAVDGARINKLYGSLGLKSTAFLSALYQEDFIDWYISSTYDQWGVPERMTDEKELSIELVNGNNGEYFAEIIGSPVLEAWSILGGEKKIRNAVLHLVDSKRKPYLFAGKMKDGKLVKKFPIYQFDTGGLFIHSFYRPVMADVDHDGKPELCIRYTVARGDGFYQKLDIFKIKNDESLELVKSFSGDPEGVALVTKDLEVLVARAYPSKKDLGHLEWDRTRFEYYRFEKGKWIKLRERSERNILMTEEFKKYFYK